MIKKLITFSPRMVEMIQEIQDTKGYVSFSSIIHTAVVELHTHIFPNYLRPLAKDEDPAKKIKRKAMEKEVKKETARNEYLRLVEELKGQVVEESGKEFCLYFTYTGKKRFEQKIPLQMVSSDMVKTQYQPSKERVEQLQREGKVDY